MKISREISLEEVLPLNKMGIILPGIRGQLHPCFERKPRLSKEEEDGLILKVLPPGHRIPVFPDTRTRLLRQVA